MSNMANTNNDTSRTLSQQNKKSSYEIFLCQIIMAKKTFDTRKNSSARNERFFL